MPGRKYSQVYIRYLKAKLSAALKPRVWITGIFLLTLLLVMQQLWFKSRPILQIINQEIEKRQLANSNSASSDSTEDETIVKSQPIVNQDSISEEDRIIAADIDNLPSLLSTVTEAKNMLALNSVNSQKKPRENQEQFLEDIINQQNQASKQKLSSVPASQNSNNTQVINNPFIQQANTLLRSDGSGGDNQVLTINRFNSSEKQELDNNDHIWINNLNYHHRVSDEQTILINPLETAIQNQRQSQQLSRNNLSLNSQTNYLQSPNNVNNLSPNYTNYVNNFSRVQQPQSLESQTSINQIPNNLNLPQNNRTNYSNSSSYNYNPNYRNLYGVPRANANQLPNSNQLPNYNQLPNSSQLPN
ncbi:MAG: hypothetical protein F6K61_21365 [Sphaerospermopsis sp. SIO1G1]|nr:hypothetical protein [Sphaerospermopsis sp. SIO1G1]